MDKINFIPYWYKKRTIRRKIKIKRTIINIVLICNSILLLLTYKYNLSYNITMDKLNNDRKILNEIILKGNKYFKTDSALSTFNMFSNRFNNKIPYTKVLIEGNTINVEVPISDIREYYEIIKYIEDVEGISIKDVNLPANDGKDLNFKVIFEVKNEKNQ